MGWVCLGTSTTQQVSQGKISASCTPRSQEMLNRNCSLMTTCKGQTVRLPWSVRETSASLPQSGYPIGEQHISIHKEVTLQNTGWSAGQKKITPTTCLFSSNRYLWANSTKCSPGARTCLGRLILLSLALVSVVGSLGFSGISHYLPYCERSSNTEEVFSFPLELFLGHCLAARQNYQSFLPKALFSGLEILRCWRSGDLRYIGRTLHLHCIILGAGQCYQSLAKME